jgi:Glycosyltransferase sugar-binding region containing DXD motif
MNQPRSIPNILHFVFGLKEQIEPFHLMYYICLASCIEVNRPEQVHFHYYHEPYGFWWDRIRPQLHLRQIDPEQFVSQYAYDDPFVAKFRYTHLADFSRLRILLEEGGIYADIDTLFLRPFPPSWLSRQFILGKEKAPPCANEDSSLCNAWIAAAPGAEFCQLWLVGMPDAFDGTWSNHSTILPYRLSREFPNLIDVEPSTSFYALDWTPRGIRDLLVRSVPLPHHAYSLHLWSHLWFENNRLDFSHFHKDLLTVEYVAYADTTYARFARCFLPQDVLPSRIKYWWQTASSVLEHPLMTVLSRLETR